MNPAKLMLGALLLASTLGGCGDYPQPFLGNPGRQGARLALPPPPRLVVSRPDRALLDTAHAVTFANAIATALAGQEVPAVTRAGRKGADWRLAITAELTGGRVVPSYAVLNPKGISQGSISGPAVSAETWALGATPALQLVAQRDAPAIAGLLNTIQAAVQQSDPNSLQNRPPRIMLAGVSGAPGDGNQALAQHMSAELTSAGLAVQSMPSGADFQLSGTVNLAKADAPGQSRVEIQWTVKDPYGHEAGHLLQMNDIPSGSLDGHWGDVAVVVAQEAAGGVRDVIVNQTQAHRIGTKPQPAAPHA